MKKVNDLAYMVIAIAILVITLIVGHLVGNFIQDKKVDLYMQEYCKNENENVIYFHKRRAKTETNIAYHYIVVSSDDNADLTIYLVNYKREIVKVILVK